MSHTIPAVEEIHIPVYCPKCFHETDFQPTLLWDRTPTKRPKRKTCNHCKRTFELDKWLHTKDSHNRTIHNFLHSTQWYDVAKKPLLLTRQMSEDNTSITTPTQHAPTPTSKIPRAHNPDQQQASTQTFSDVQSLVRKDQRVQALVQQQASTQTASDVQLPVRKRQRVRHTAKSVLKVFGPIHPAKHP